MLISVGYGNDGLLRKRSISLKEQNFTILEFYNFTLWYYVWLGSPLALLWCEGPLRKGWRLFGLLAFVISSMDFLALMVSAKLFVIFLRIRIYHVSERRCLLLQQCCYLCGGCSCRTQYNIFVSLIHNSIHKVAIRYWSF